MKKPAETAGYVSAAAYRTLVTGYIPAVVYRISVETYRTSVETFYILTTMDHPLV